MEDPFVTPPSSEGVNKTVVLLQRLQLRQRLCLIRKSDRKRLNGLSRVS
jgi:hypothetical protein